MTIRICGAAHAKPLLAERRTVDLADMGRSVQRPYEDGKRKLKLKARLWMAGCNAGACAIEFAKTPRLRSFVAKNTPQDDNSRSGESLRRGKRASG